MPSAAENLKANFRGQIKQTNVRTRRPISGQDTKSFLAFREHRLRRSSPFHSESKKPLNGQKKGEIPAKSKLSVKKTV